MKIFPLTHLIFSTGTVHIIPVLGGYVADSCAGKFNTILGAGIMYTLGRNNCLSVCLSICLYIYLCICLSLYLLHYLMISTMLLYQHVPLSVLASV